jgi:hypothetical protein
MRSPGTPNDRAVFRHGRQDNDAAREAFGRTHRRFIVFPGLDPGIQADSVVWGDPRIRSGDDEEKKILSPSGPSS